MSNLVNINNYIPAPPPIAWGTPIPDLTNEILQQIIEAWNSIPHTVKLNGIRPQSDRYEKLRVVYAMIGLDGIMRAIQRVRDSKWMQNQGHIAFNSFIANPDRVNELLEGNYDVVFETERKPKTRKESSFDNFSQRDYDYAELEKKLMGKN